MRFRVNTPSVMHQTIDGEVVIIHLETGRYYSLRGSGAVIWGLTQCGIGPEDVAAALVARYGVDATTAQDCVRGLLGELQGERLIVELDAGAPPEQNAAGETTGQPAPDGPFQPPLLEKFDDMRELILLDPVHEVDAEKGWPHYRGRGPRR